MRSEIKQVKDKLEDKIAEMKEFKRSLEEEFERKSEKLIADSKADPDDLLTRQNGELRGKIEDLQKQLFQKGKEIEHLLR